MRLAILAALLLTGASAPQSKPNPPAPHSFDRMNLMREQPGCASIPQQVAGEDRRYDGTRLDRQPPGQLLLAVDREVGGCREVVLMRDELRRRGR